jgi:hypothetical protein
MAIVVAGTVPEASDWQDATISVGRLRLLVGPEGGALTLTADMVYDVWTWIVDVPEVPIELVGQVHATP